MQCPDCKTPYDDSVEYCSICGKVFTKKDREDYQKYLLSDNPELLAKVREDNKRAIQARKDRDREMSNNTNLPKCPTCGSTDLERIGTLDRMFSVGFFGLASGKIGKQFKCRNCKYMW